MQVSYGYLWNEQLGELIDPIGEDRARKQWETAGEPFEVVLGDPARPSVTINANPDAQGFQVFFYDDQGRRELCYTLEPHGDGRLFVQDVTGWHWDDPDAMEPDEASRIESYQYRDDGYVRQVTTQAGDPDEHITESEDVPLDINWEPVPSFGDWASLARRHRDHGPDHSSNRIP